MSFQVGVELTRRCNFKCRHCYVDAGRARAREAGTAEMSRWLESLSRAGVQTVGWSGGEPLIRPDVEELTHRARALGMRVGLASNGYLLTAPRAHALFRAGLGVAQVSLDGPTPERAAQFRHGPADSFPRAQRALELFRASGVYTVVCALFSPETAADLEPMMALARRLGAQCLRYTAWTPVGRAAGQSYDEAAWGSPAVRRFLDVAAEHRQDPELRVLLDCPSGPLPGVEGFACHAGHHTAYVMADGDVYPCTSLIFPEYRVGNAREAPLEELLTHRRRLRVHTQRARSPAAGACTGCARLDTCGGGCPGRSVAAFGHVRRGPHQGAMPACLVRLHTPAPAASRRPARRSSP